jgi:hypothetical protein
MSDDLFAYISGDFGIECIYVRLQDAPYVFVLRTGAQLNLGVARDSAKTCPTGLQHSKAVASQRDDGSVAATQTELAAP